MTCRVDYADCLDWLAAMPPQSADLVFGSPPYEAARLYLENGQDLKIARNTEEWVAWMVKVFQASLRVCRGLVAFVVEGQTRQYRYSAGPALLMADLHRAGVHLRKPPIFQRVGIPGSGGADWLRNDWEWIICATNGGKLPWSDNTAYGQACKFGPGGTPSHRTQDGRRINGEKMRRDKRIREIHQPDGTKEIQHYKPPALANPGNVIRCKVGGGLLGSPLAHENEAPFPEALVTPFVLSFAPPGGLVLDPFVGSGTTGAVAVRHCRNFAGCDVRESQVRLARRRIELVTPQQLFEGPS